MFHHRPTSASTTRDPAPIGASLWSRPVTGEHETPSGGQQGNPFLRSSRFRDFGQYREHLRHWDTEAVQISAGVLTIDFDCVEMADLVLSRLRFDRDATLHTVNAPGWCTFGLYRSAQRWCGVDVQPNTFVAVAPGRETHIVSHEPFDAFRVTVQRDTLAAWEGPLARFIDGTSAPDRQILTAAPDAIARFSAWVQQLLGARMPSLSSEDTALWVAAIQARLKRHLAEIGGRRCVPPPASPMIRVARYDLVLAALRLMHPEAQHRHRVTDLATSLGVSPRSLEYAFAAVLGISPGQYILAERLNRARHHLILGAATGTSVTAIAFDHQFDHLSRFAQQYTRLFDERPSDTLRTARAAIRRA